MKNQSHYQNNPSHQHEPQPQPNPDNITITPQTLTQITNSLTQSIQLNTSLRIKYPDQPLKYYHTEQSIHTILQSLSQSLSQQHLPLIISSHISLNFIKLLTHPNIDLSLQILQILYDLLEEQPQNDQLFEIYYRWVISMIDNSTVQALISILTKLDQQNNIEQYQAGLKCLKLIEIFINVTQKVYQILSQDKQLFEYLANRIMPNFIVKHKIIDDNKYVSSDILVSLLSNSEKSQHLFSQFSGIQVLLETIASYETKLPTNQDEKQFLNNLFSCLSILLMNFLLPQNKRAYFEMKGNYLMISFLKMKNEYSGMALKCMANSLLGLRRQEQQQVVKGIVNDGGLKYIFAVVRRKGIRGEDVQEQKGIDENCVNIIYSMVRSLRQVYKDRLEYKLMQNRYENLQRLFEMRGEYMQIVDEVEVEDDEQQKEQQRQKQQNKQQQQNGHNKQKKRNRLLYLSRLSQGLSIVQVIDKTLLIIVQRYNRLIQKVGNLVNIYKLEYQKIEKIIKEHYEYVGMKEEKEFVEMLMGKNLRLMKRVVEKEKEQRDVKGKGKEDKEKIKRQQQLENK